MPTKKELEQQIKYYRDRLSDYIVQLGQLAWQQEKQREIIIQLYYASHWDSDRLTDDFAKILWEQVKEAFELTEDAPKRISINDPGPGD